MVVVVITVLWTIPTFGLAVTSVRTKSDAANSGWWEFFFHPHLTLQNYHDVLAGTGGSGGSIAPYFVNSIAITIPATLIPLALGSMAAYALAWVKFRGSTFIFFCIFALQVVPMQLALVPLLQLFSHGMSIGHQSILPLQFTSTSHHGAVDPAPHADDHPVPRVGLARSIRCGSRTRCSACHWSSSCCTTSCRSCQVT